MDESAEIATCMAELVPSPDPLGTGKSNSGGLSVDPTSRVATTLLFIAKLTTSPPKSEGKGATSVHPPARSTLRGAEAFTISTMLCATDVKHHFF